jgi:hypothetical protein
MSRNNDNFNQCYPGAISNGKEGRKGNGQRKSPGKDAGQLLNNDPAYQQSQNEIDRHWWEAQDAADK